MRQAMLRRTGARHIVVRPDIDWLMPLVYGLRRPMPRRRAG
jgi:hypothetical protein